jgi:uncharacterized alkaline shock family protein YloU
MMMRLLHKTVRILVLAGVLSVGLGLLGAAASKSVWQQVEDMVGDARAGAAWAGLAVVCLGMLYALTGLRRRSPEKFLSFDNEGGAVSMSTAAIADYIAKLATEFPSVVKLRPRVLPRSKGVDIVVDLRVRAGPQIHEVCELVQQRVREAVTNGLGISEIRRITVSVRDIVSEHRPG